MTTEIRVSIRNESEAGGTAFTPAFLGFHDGSFDIYNLGETASAGLEALAEDGNNSIIAGELLAADGDAQTANLVGPRGPVAAGEQTSTIVSVNGASNGHLSLASMILPSNDAFFGTADSVELFDENGVFLGAQTLSFDGGSVRDAGTEVNTEQDAAFINQTGPNTGITENGVVSIHEGFNGSEGNPGGDQIILGGTNAFGETIDPTAADFTRDGAQIATVHINTVNRYTGSDNNDVFIGGRDDDLVDAGNGNDVIFGGNGWDELSGGNGHDFLSGGQGNDILNGGNGEDFLRGGAGNDILSGDEGNDALNGGSGNDYLSGGNGEDTVSGGSGNDLLEGGQGNDLLRGNSGNDLLSGGSGDDELRGGSGNDALSGDAGNDLLRGNSGADSLNGGDGDDRLIGGSGDDLLTGDAGNDVLYGNAGADALSGGAGNDNLLGGSGDDRLSGDSGYDFITGGSGNDVFEFHADSGIDVVTDFDRRGNDAIELSFDGVDSFDDVQSAALQQGHNAVLDFGDNNLLILQNVDVDALDASDFLFA